VGSVSKYGTCPVDEAKSLESSGRPAELLTMPRPMPWDDPRGMALCDSPALWDVVSSLEFTRYCCSSAEVDPEPGYGRVWCDSETTCSPPTPPAVLGLEPADSGVVTVGINGWYIAGGLKFAWAGVFG
jgi:hypothetical protein